MRSINISKLSLNAWASLDRLDESFIGTEDYMGIAYFWNYYYKYRMRDATGPQRVRIHEKLMEAGVKCKNGVFEYCDDCTRIICKVLRLDLDEYKAQLEGHQQADDLHRGRMARKQEERRAKQLETN